jgi:hypothetical protein
METHAFGENKSLFESPDLSHKVGTIAHEFSKALNPISLTITKQASSTYLIQRFTKCSIRIQFDLSYIRSNPFDGFGNPRGFCMGIRDKSYKFSSLPNTKEQELQIKDTPTKNEPIPVKPNLPYSKRKEDYPLNLMHSRDKWRFTIHLQPIEKGGVKEVWNTTWYLVLIPEIPRDVEIS